MTSQRIHALSPSQCWGRAEALAEWMLKEGLLQPEAPVSVLLANENVGGEE